MFILNYLSIYLGVSTSKTYPFYFGKIFKKLNIWVFTKHFNIAKYIDYLEKNSIRSLVWLGLLWSSNSRLFRSKVLVNVLNSVTTPVIFVLTLMMRSTEISIFTIQTPGNEILMPNTEKSLDLYCWCPPRKIYENKVTMNLIFFFSNSFTKFPSKPFWIQELLWEHVFTFWFVPAKIR